MKGDVARVHSKLVEHVASVLEFLVVRIGLAQLRYCLAVTWLSLVIFVLSEVYATQGELADCLVDAIAGALLGGELIVLDCLDGVATGEVEVANGIVNLVEVFLVAVVASHALEGIDLALDVVALEHSTLLDACVELGAVGRRIAAASTLVGLIGFFFLACLVIELSQQEVKAHLLSAASSVYCFLKERHCIGVHLGLDVVVGKSQVGELLQSRVFDFAGMDVSEHIVGLGCPVHSAVAQSLPYLSL